MGSLADVERNWQVYARADPMWAALMDPEKLGGGWDVEPFFAAGEAEIATVIDHLAKVGLRVDFSGTALDFGCGVGRLTQALAVRFASVWGVDISSAMIELAGEFNRHPESCHYLVNASEHLSVFESNTFAFIYTSIVLQHMEP